MSFYWKCRDRPLSSNPHAQPRSLERFTCCRGASPKGRNQRAIAAQSLTLQRPPASLECAAAAGPLRSSALRFTGSPLPWPPAPAGSGCLPAQLSCRAKSPQTPLSDIPAGLEHCVQEGKLRNKKPQVPGRHSHLSSPELGLGSFFPPRFLLPWRTITAAAGPAWDERTGRAMASCPHSTCKSFLHAQNQLSFHPW